ncbi:hypothetical protein [Corallococcus llansteffanensis]|uniref:hypothetical protein n=1 Tax=Corallococcus llansteffanensis TaxID=2316731 RepID=UPI0011C3E765|nr:hypothetical protein [Corallococcus llansteffanensis]
MLEVRNRPALTETFRGLTDFVPSAGSAYVFGSSGEARSAHGLDWEHRAQGVKFVPIVSQDAASIAVKLGEETSPAISLRSVRALDAFWGSLATSVVYLDITGLGHHVWAPLLRTALSGGRTVRVVYVEPTDYRYSLTPTEGDIFDLSERISGIAPLPGFASLAGPRDDVVFVPLLGFEGTRLQYVFEQVQPPGNKTVPLVGVPGFRPEYPFHTLYGNRAKLLETRAWRNMEFARANCPFSAMYALSDIAARWPKDAIKIAPIGTKPHALGAVLFYLTTTRTVELVYDHPIRKKERTIGAASVFVYHVSALQFVGPRVGVSTPQKAG